MLRPIALFTACVAVAACASATSQAPTPAPAPAAPAARPTTPPPPPPPTGEFNAEGRYALTIAFQGRSLPVTVELWREDGAWYGTGSSAAGSANLSRVAVNGRNLRLTFTADGGPSFVLTLDVKADNTVTGTWSGGGDGSAITGRKVQ